MADEAIHYMKRLKEIAPGKPWLVYYVPGATPCAASAFGDIPNSQDIADLC